MAQWLSSGLVTRMSRVRNHFDGIVLFGKALILIIKSLVALNYKLFGPVNKA